MNIPLPELYVYSYDQHLQPNVNSLAVGWLDKKFTYNTGSVSKVFLDRLGLFCMDPVVMPFDQANCPLCLEYPIIDTPHGRLEFGPGELRIPSQSNIVYAAPTMIYHFIKDHNYQPPQEFIEAVLKAPLPDSQEYKEFIRYWRKH
jgi:hypothetical protein